MSLDRVFRALLIKEEHLPTLLLLKEHFGPTHDWLTVRLNRQMAEIIEDLTPTPAPIPKPAPLAEPKASNEELLDFIEALRIDPDSAQASHSSSSSASSSPSVFAKPVPKLAKLGKASSTPTMPHLDREPSPTIPRKKSPTIFRRLRAPSAHRQSYNPDKGIRFADALSTQEVKQLQQAAEKDATRPLERPSHEKEKKMQREERQEQESEKGRKSRHNSGEKEKMKKKHQSDEEKKGKKSRHNSGEKDQNKKKKDPSDEGAESMEKKKKVMQSKAEAKEKGKGKEKKSDPAEKSEALLNSSSHGNSTGDKTSSTSESHKSVEFNLDQ